MSDRTTTAVTAGQQLALDQLRQITGSARGGVFLAHVDTAPAKAPTGFVEARISVGCAGLSRAEGGLRLRTGLRCGSAHSREWCCLGCLGCGASGPW